MVVTRFIKGNKVLFFTTYHILQLLIVIIWAGHMFQLEHSIYVSGPAEIYKQRLQ